MGFGRFLVMRVSILDFYCPALWVWKHSLRKNVRRRAY